MNLMRQIKTPISPDMPTYVKGYTLKLYCISAHARGRVACARPTAIALRSAWIQAIQTFHRIRYGIITDIIQSKFQSVHLHDQARMSQQLVQTVNLQPVVHSYCAAADVLCTCTASERTHNSPPDNDGLLRSAASSQT